MMAWRSLTVLIMSLLLAAFALAQEGPLDDPAEEARAQALMRELRCVACENEPISQSAAPIAEDMRARVRSLVGEGKSDAEVRDWFEARYGEFVLFRPPQRGVTGWLLWTSPFLILALGGFIAFRIARASAGRAGEIEAEDV